jgi:hypothetical protein
VRLKGFFPLALQPQFGPWPTSMKLSVSLQFTRSWTFGRTPWTGDQPVARPLPTRRTAQTQKNAHTLILNIHALSGSETHDHGFRASEDSTCLRPLGYRDRQQFASSSLFLFGPQDEGHKFLQNVGLPSNYRALQPSWPFSSVCS